MISIKNILNARSDFYFAKLLNNALRYRESVTCSKCENKYKDNDNLESIKEDGYCLMCGKQYLDI